MLLVGDASGAGGERRAFDDAAIAFARLDHSGADGAYGNFAGECDAVGRGAHA